jgi:hypothetical protein
MRDKQENIDIFIALGNKLDHLSPDEFATWVTYATAQNKWFTESLIRQAIANIRKLLTKDSLIEWSSQYKFSNNTPQRIGLVLAGNIPLVGFHDILSVLISGHIAVIKASSQDSVLIQKVLDLLIEIQPNLALQIELVEKITNADAYIATGSDNTARYFEYYFSSKPNIIRKNRTSVAVLNGKEQENDFQLLGEDMFSYFGLGCRNVSKIYLPEGFDPTDLIKHLGKFSYLADHNKYGNNYEYNRAIYLLKGIQYYDNGFFLLKEDESLVSPISVIYYSFYNNLADLQNYLNTNNEKIQIISSKDGWYEGSLSFGEAQKPSLFDYADNVDTMAFLEML